MGADGRLCHSNPEAAAQLGYTLAELTAMPWLQLLHEQSRLVGYDSWQRVQTHRQSEAVSLNLLARDGTIVVVHGYADSEGQDPSGQVAYHLHSVTPDCNGGPPPTVAEPIAFVPSPGYRTPYELPVASAIEDQTELITRSLPDTTLIAVNAAYCRAIGKSEAEVLGRRFLDLLPPPEQAQVEGALRSLTPDRPVAYTEHLLRLANGEQAYFQWSNRGRFDPQGRLYEIQSVGRNIQPYKQIQQRLQQSENAFRQLFDATAIGLAQTTVGEGRYLRVNRKLCEILGYSEAELLGITYQQITHPDDLPACTIYVQNLLAGKIRSHPIQKRFLHKDGTIVWCNTTVSLLCDVTGKPIYAIAALEDITAQKAIEQALQASQTTLQHQTQILQSVLNSLNEGVIVLDTSGHVYLSNTTARQLLQFIPADTRHWASPPWGDTDLGPHFYQADGQTPCPPADFPIQRAMRGEVVDNQEVYLVSAEQEQGTWLSFTACPLCPVAGGIQGSVIVFRDITRYKQVEAKILNALRQEKELGEMRSRFLSVTSHEFRSPLTTIIAATALLQRYEWSRAEQLEELNLIQREALHLNALLEDTLIVDQAETGQLQLLPEPFDLEALCRQVIRGMALEQGSQTPIALQGASDFPNPIWADKKLVQQILTNLISNALKYSPQGNPVQVTYGCEDDQVVIQVRDRGLGIPPEDQPHLFECFYRAKNVGTIAGTGLGLSIVHKCVTLHGGTIAITSEVGVGTTVIVKFPLRLPD
ncbi:PAS domain S-box protein [Trichothermofontia sp.]